MGGEVRRTGREGNTWWELWRYYQTGGDREWMTRAGTGIGEPGDGMSFWRQAAGKAVGTGVAVSIR